ncbi:hypothetical protein [Micromonospora zamorensis]|uniref:hypothetical protein n=1 Tax=Micromonospora zamorensis TaxID=709883 RepID=UPI0033B50306
MARSSTSSFSGDINKWLALGSALAAVGILPKGWQKALAGASAAILVVKMLE